MTLSMFERTFFNLACGHDVILGRLDQAKTWTCERCGNVTDLRADPYCKKLEHARDTADRIDKQARQRGDTVVRSED